MKNVVKQVQGDISDLFLRHVAFTLAETLITLSILGLVAALTIPTLVHKFQDRIAITQVKKTAAMLDNALQQMYVLEGKPQTWDWPTTSIYNVNNRNYFAEKLAKYLPVQKYCGSDDGCFGYGYKNAADGYYIFATLPGDKTYSSYVNSGVHGKMILKNDMRLSVSQAKPFSSSSWWDNPKSCRGIIRVDINGPKGPNRFGYDVFYFTFDDDGLEIGKVKESCLILSDGKNAAYKDACNINKKNINSGISCSVWIMRHNNMDYKYRDVSEDW